MRKITRTVAITVSFALLAMIGVQTAVSAREDDPQTVVVTATRSAPNGGVGAQSIITCTISIDNPHKSGHVIGTANVVSHWVCSGFVPRLTLSTKLWRSGIQVGSGNSAANGSAWLNGNAAATCLNAQYQGTASGTVTFPPGYNPPSGSANVSSPVVAISNC